MTILRRFGDTTVSLSVWRQWRWSWETWRDGWGNRMAVLDMGPLSLCVDSLWVGDHS